MTKASFVLHHNFKRNRLLAVAFLFLQKRLLKILCRVQTLFCGTRRIAAAAIRHYRIKVTVPFIKKGLPSAFTPDATQANTPVPCASPL